MIIDEWKEIMPDFTFLFWTDNHLNKYQLKFVKQAYRKKHYAFVSDYIRLVKVAEHGGFYLDTDMKLFKRLDDFISNDFVISSEVPGRPNWAFFGASKGNVLLLNCIERYRDLTYDEFKPPVIPYHLMDLVNQGLLDNPDKYLNLPSAYFYPLPQKEAGNDYLSFVTQETVGVHLWDFSWSSIKQDRQLFNEVCYRFCVLIKDFFSFDYPLYYFKINLIRIKRLIRR